MREVLAQFWGFVLAWWVFLNYLLFTKTTAKYLFLEDTLDANWVPKVDPVKVLMKAAKAETKKCRCDRIILTLLLQGNYL